MFYNTKKHTHETAVASDSQLLTPKILPRRDVGRDVTHKNTGLWNRLSSIAAHAQTQ